VVYGWNSGLFVVVLIAAAALIVDKLQGREGESLMGLG